MYHFLRSGGGGGGGGISFLFHFHISDVMLQSLRKAWNDWGILQLADG